MKSRLPEAVLFVLSSGSPFLDVSHLTTSNKKFPVIRVLRGEKGPKSISTFSDPFDPLAPLIDAALDRENKKDCGDG